MDYKVASNGEEFIKKLLLVVPEVAPAYAEHLADNDTLLPHVFMGDVTRYAIREFNNSGSRAAMVRLLDYLEEGMKLSSGEIRDIIVGSFVENLTGETTAVEALKPIMGPLLKAEVEAVFAVNK